MSLFEVKVRKLDTVLPHPNADKLELAQVGGYRAVVKKGEFVNGDYALYVPNDSVIPNHVAEGLGIKPYLVGKYKNRVKAIRLRGEVSQGIVISLHTLTEYVWKFFTVNGELNSKWFAWFQRYFTVINDQLDNTLCDLSEFLEIMKYEEEIPVEMKGHVRPWPKYLDHYDIENVNHPDCINLLKEGEEVIATEKLHGSNMAISIGPGLEEGETVFVCSRRLAIKESEENLYWKAVRQYGLDVALMRAYQDIKKTINDPEFSITLRGEIVGMQDLKYGFSRGTPGFYAFDIKINNYYQEYDGFRRFCSMYGFSTVPEIYRGPYFYDKFKELSQGTSRLSGEVREGIVVRPVHERYDENIGRVVLKFINEDYLIRSEGTELH